MIVYQTTHLRVFNGEGYDKEKLLLLKYFNNYSIKQWLKTIMGNALDSVRLPQFFGVQQAQHVMSQECSAMREPCAGRSVCVVFELQSVIYFSRHGLPLPSARNQKSPKLEPCQLRQRQSCTHFED